MEATGRGHVRDAGAELGSEWRSSQLQEVLWERRDELTLLPSAATTESMLGRFSFYFTLRNIQLYLKCVCCRNPRDLFSCFTTLKSDSATLSFLSTILAGIWLLLVLPSI